MEVGEDALLPANGVHLFADDLLDLLMHDRAQRQKRIHAAHQLPDVSPAQQQAMTGCLGSSRVFPQRGYECS